MLHALHSGKAERDHVGDSKPCLKDDCGSGLLFSEKHSVDAKARRVYTRLQKRGNLKLHFVGELRAAPCGQYPPAGSRRDCPLTVSSTVGILIPLSGNWVPAWSIRVLKPTDEESQDAPTPSVTVWQTVKVALKGFEDINIELIALVQNPDFSRPENENDTVELTRAPVRAGSLARGLDPTKMRTWTSSFAPRSNCCGKMQCASVVSRILSLVGASQLLHSLVSRPSRFFLTGELF